MTVAVIIIIIRGVMAVIMAVGVVVAVVITCNNSGYECCGRKEGRRKGRNNWKEYHSTSRARKVRSEIRASYCNILKVS